MTTIERDVPAGSPDDESYNLAARVYDHEVVALESDPEAVPAASRAYQYNLAAQVYGLQPRALVPDATTEVAAPPATSNGHADTNGHAPSNGAVAVARPQGPVDGGGSGRTRTFDAFAVSGFRWFFVAMLGQMASMNMQMLVRGYLVFLLTGSYAALGTISLANAIPGLSLSLVGGVLADWAKQKKYVVQAGQLLNAINALAVALLLYFDMLTFTHLFIASLVQGTIQALMMPARQSMIPEVVGLKRLMNAVALNSAGMNSMRLLAPAAGGFLLAAFGPHWIYFMMTGLYLFASVFLLPVPKVSEADVAAAAARRRSRGGGGLSQMIDGVRYIAHDSTLRTILGVNVLLIVMAMPYIFLLPGFVADVLNEGPSKLGLLLSATGAGSLFGALIIASLPPKRRGLLFLLSSAAQGVGLLAFSASTWFWVTMPIMVFMGIGQAGRQSFSNVLVQTYVEDDYRGRVMAVYMLQFSLTSFGTFFVGLLAAVVGAQIALGATSVAMIVIALGALVFAPSLRKLD
ncbi:MAG: MFS transporter [Dehalococcoidia bacterium]